MQEIAILMVQFFYLLEQILAQVPCLNDYGRLVEFSASKQPTFVIMKCHNKPTVQLTFSCLREEVGTGRGMLIVRFVLFVY